MTAAVAGLRELRLLAKVGAAEMILVQYMMFGLVISDLRSAENYESVTCRPKQDPIPRTLR